MRAPIIKELRQMTTKFRPQAIRLTCDNPFGLRMGAIAQAILAEPWVTRLVTTPVVIEAVVSVTEDEDPVEKSERLVSVLSMWSPRVSADFVDLDEVLGELGQHAAKRRANAAHRRQALEAADAES